MATRKLVVFRHATALGNAHAHALFDRVKTWRVHDGEQRPTGDTRTDNWPPARAFTDYAITIDHEGLPDGIEILKL
jgi:CRISPR-associated protein Csd2